MSLDQVRRLHRQAVTAAGTVDAGDTKAMRVIRAAMEAEAEANRIAEQLSVDLNTTQVKLASCEAELAACRAQIEQMNTDHGAQMNQMQCCVDQMKSDATEYGSKYSTDMATWQKQCDNLSASLVAANEKCARLEAAISANGDTRKFMESLVGKVQNQASQPIIAPAPSKPFPFRLEVSARDANGRIAAITATPTT